MSNNLHFGFKHIALRVADVRKAAHFYQHALKMQPLLEQDGGCTIIMTTPDCRDVLTLSEISVQSEMDLFEPRTILPGTIDHIGFEIGDNALIAQTVRDSLEAGAELIGEVETIPGYPSAFIRDPDGHILQLYGFSADLRAMFPVSSPSPP